MTTAEDDNIIIKRFLLLTNTHSLISTYLFSWQSEWPWITFRTLEDGINNCVFCMLHMKHTIDTDKHKKSQAFELKDKVSMIHSHNYNAYMLVFSRYNVHHVHHLK